MSSDELGGLQGHIIILGWSDRVRRIIGELRDPVHRGSNDLFPILVITPSLEDYESVAMFEKVYFIHGRLNDPAVLRRGRLDKARSLLIPTCLGDVGASDGESVFSLLAALTVHPETPVCVEIAKTESGNTLEEIRNKSLKGTSIEVVAFESVAERLLAQAAINRGVTRVYSHLLTFSETSNELYVTKLSPVHTGKTFRQLATEAFDRTVILLGYERGDDLVLNPTDRDVVLYATDNVWFMSYNKRDGLLVFCPEALQAV